MCGIAGIYHFKKTHKDSKYSNDLEILLNNIKHRGPDDQGVAHYDLCSIGMVRLSIIDLQTGHQPMHSEDDRYSIIFNGEIYNFQSIKDGLIEKGVEFKTVSDTEVVLKGFIAYGKDILNKLEGMFALAIYDSKKHDIFIARDRLGKKPLYYYQDEEKIIFCSEVQALTQLEDLSLTLSSQSYWDYLTYRYIPGENTAYNQIKMFGRGQFTVISSNSSKRETYWKVPYTKTTEYPEPNHFKKLFSASVKKRLISDVPVGVMLSGGIDSCAVLYEAAKHQKIDSYHVFFDTTDKNYNELKYAEKMAKSVNSNLHVVEASREDFYEQLINIATITDEPLADLAAIPFKMVCDLAAKDVKVALSGEGSDEILAGYGIGSIPKRMRLLSLLKLVPKPVRDMIRKVLEIKMQRSISLFDEVEYKTNNWAKFSNYNITNQINQQDKVDLLRDDLDNTFLDSYRILNSQYKQLSDEDVVNQMLHVISEDWLEQDVLMKSDKVSMSSSLELRCPFLDHHLVEYLFSLNGKQKVGVLNGKQQSKILLKEYLYKKIPDQLVFRKKLGFPVPTYDIQEKNDLDFIYDILSSKNCYYQQYFSIKSIMNILDSIKNNFSETHSMKHFLWSVVVYELWLKGGEKQERIIK